MTALESSVHGMQRGIDEILGRLRAAQAFPAEQGATGGVGAGAAFGFGLGEFRRRPSRGGGSEGASGGRSGALNLWGVPDITATFPPFGEWARKDAGEGGGGAGAEAGGAQEMNGSASGQNGEVSAEKDAFRRGRREDRAKEKDKEERGRSKEKEKEERGRSSSRRSSRSRRESEDDGKSSSSINGVAYSQRIKSGSQKVRPSSQGEGGIA